MINFNEKPLFILEMANNHMGDVAHGIHIISEFKKVCDDFPEFLFSFKLQLRDTEFIHPDYLNRKDIKQVKRFAETKLSDSDFARLSESIREHGFITMCTPWDEKSVEVMESLNYEIIKIASCSFVDWPLLEAVVKTNRPIVISTGGATTEEIDSVVSFLQHRNKNFCLMHCVGAYPTPHNQLQMNQIDYFRQRYPQVNIGFSTHEDPDNFEPVMIAVGKNIKVFERHVGVPTKSYSLNAYSSTPEQIRKWLEKARHAYEMCGITGRRMDFSDQEKADLVPLFRAAFAHRDIASGEKISHDNVFYSIPNTPGQIVAREMSKYIEYSLVNPIKKNQPIMHADVVKKHLREKVLSIVVSLKKMLKESKVVVPNKIDMEISCHYGLEKFEEWGGILLKIVNREYCKMLLVLFPGQKYPMHNHQKKEETLLLLHGDLSIELQGKEHKINSGDAITVERGENHCFSTINGAIIEEISTTYFKGDSYYSDSAIANNVNRKIELTYWVDL
jgi:sialic acid synthase SpsE/mannose-6-phosphate isomerase-like protein (cupin superfamily)